MWYHENNSTGRWGSTTRDGSSSRRRRTPKINQALAEWAEEIKQGSNGYKGRVTGMVPGRNPGWRGSLTMVGSLLGEGPRTTTFAEVGAAGPLRRKTSATRTLAHMMVRQNKPRCGARPLEIRRGGGVPGPTPQRDPFSTTGGHLTQPCVDRRQGARNKATGQPEMKEKNFNIMQ